MVLISELNKLDKAALLKEEVKLRKQILDMRIDRKAGKLLQSSKMKETRKTLARVLTILNRK